jgi:hypothetical protein
MELSIGPAEVRFALNPSASTARPQHDGSGIQSLTPLVGVKNIIRRKVTGPA